MSIFTKALTDIESIGKSIESFVSKEEAKLGPIAKNFVKNVIPAAEQVYADVIAVMAALKSGDPLIPEGIALIQAAEALAASLKAL